jgi:hypothetical protein
LVGEEMLDGQPMSFILTENLDDAPNDLSWLKLPPLARWNGT